MPVCFFLGHHDAPEAIQPLVDEAVLRHIRDYGVDEFVMGSYGNFDRMAARAVRNAKARCPELRLTLLLAYYRPEDHSILPPGFDGSLYPEGMESVPKWAAIVRANRYMIQHCDDLIAYDRGQIGNTRKLMKYARRRAEQGLLHVENLGCGNLIL